MELIGDRIVIKERGMKTRFRGECPDVPLSEAISTEDLYGDEPVGERLHVTLRLWKRGIISENMLFYDDALSEAIASQMLEGAIGAAGHDGGQFPPIVAYWVGIYEDKDGVFWGKAYIPPGETRDTVRRMKGLNLGIETSILGSGEPISEDGVMRVSNFVLERMDVLLPNTAAVRMPRDMTITKESIQHEDKPMPDNIEITIDDVPKSIREQIVKEAKSAATAQRVNELEAEVASLQESVSAYGSIRAIFGNDVDSETLIESVAEMHRTLEALRSMFPEAQDIQVHISAMRDRYVEARQQAHESRVAQAIAQATDWKVSSDANRAALDAVRKQIAQSITVDADADDDAVVEAVNQTVETMKPILEAVKLGMAGPPAAVHSTPERKGSAVDDATLDDIYAKVGKKRS